MNIDRFKIGEGRTFIIAEIGNNHNGDIKKAFELVDKAVEVGADCAKFQMRHLDQVYRQRSLAKSGEDLGTEYILDLLEKFELEKNLHHDLFDYCRSKDILYLCTPWDDKSIEVLESFPVPAYKVASADLTNTLLLESLVKTKKPLILSTGMSRTNEILYARDFLKDNKCEFAFLHCNSTYPAPVHDINLNWLHQLKEFHPNIGYSGHERGISISLAAVALGAQIIERHLTLDRNMEGPDHAASLEPGEFLRLVQGAREIEEAKGTTQYERQLSQGEMINRENLSKSLVATGQIKSGTIITKDHIAVKSPGQGLSPQKINELIGKEIQRDMEPEDYFFPNDLLEQKIEPRAYTFSRPWGVPVRYHDFSEYVDRISPDLFEFHLSYSDMGLDLSNYFNKEFDCDFVVHAPELFEGSHLMDLATPDEAYRNQSLKETQKVIDITRALNQYFPKTKNPMIVANVGGISMDANLPKESLPAYYERFAHSLKELDTEGVEIIPQTMAPFPWHFGGQRYQNIFVHIEEIVEWCSKLNLRMCFDVSHTMLTCNHFGYDFYDFASQIAPYTAHLHLGDAEGLNGEGLQVGDGQIDFNRLGRILKDKAPGAWFIPEIWQGHKNGGEGFWIALERLEGKL